MALTTGVLGGFGHCIGMCGPLVASYSFSDRPPGPQLLPHLLYNAGRITTYSAIGGLMGLTGSFLSFAGRIAGLQNAVALFAGIAMIVMGLNITGILGSSRWIERHNLPILRAARLAASSASPFRYVLLGSILGLLPCGLSYTIFVAAAGSGGFSQGLVMAMLFGLGTLPALLVFGTLVSLIGSKVRGRIYRAGGFLVISMGIYFLWRGMQLYAPV
jgi:hypothetical protein